MKMKIKTIFSLLLPLLALACAKPGTSPDNPGGKKASEYRLTVDGKPFMMVGAQLRMDFFRDLDKKKLDELDKYFELAASLNITVVQLAFSWSDVEKDYDVYSDETVKAYIDYCEKWGLKAELLWFGSYMCGYSVESHLPAYIVADNTTYPELKPSAAYQGWQGKQFFLSPGNSKLLERETKAARKLMDFIYEYDRSIGSPHTIIGIQVENEPDMLPTRHNGAHGYSATDLWPSLLHHLDQMGRAFKSGKYDCYTRVNQTCEYDDWVYWSKMVAKREGIDYVGFDPYRFTLSDLEARMESMLEIEGNFAHVAENGGEAYNNDILTLKALTMGGGYEVFEVVTTPHPYIAEFTLRGVYNTDFTPKGQTQRLIDANLIFKNGWYDFATAPVANMKGFNLTDDQGLNSTRETAQLPGVKVDWQTSSRGIAYAIEAGDYVLVGSTKPDRMTFGFDVLKVEPGRYDADGNWVADPRGAKYADSSLQLEACTVYRVYKK